jgi:hypothetical protein
MVDADSPDSPDDGAFVDDISQRCVSIDSLKQHDAGQMLILMLQQRPLDRQQLHREKLEDERHGVR